MQSTQGEGGTPLMLGGHAFRVTGFGYTGMDRKTNNPDANLEIVGIPDVGHWTGPKGQEITIKGVLFPLEFGGFDTLDALRADSTAGRVMTLITGGGDILGRYRCDSIDEQMDSANALGTPRKVSYTLHLKRRGGAGLGGGGLGGLGGMIGAAIGAARGGIGL
jgi:uncharacterized protein